jgi:hypothetical protein
MTESVEPEAIDVLESPAQNYEVTLPESEEGPELTLSQKPLSFFGKWSYSLF